MFVRPFVGLLALSALLASVPVGASGEDAQKRVLVLHQARRDAPLSIEMEAVYRRVLGEAFGHRLDYYSESIDVSRFGQPKYESALRNYLRSLYGHRQIDVVIATSSSGVDLIRQSEDELFPGASLVFHARAGAAIGLRATGVESRFDPSATLKLALTLHPGVKHVAVVGGSSAIDMVYGALTRTQFQTFNDRLSFTYLYGLPIRELKAAIARLPGDAVVFFVSLTQDGAGQRLMPVEVLDQLSAVAKVPVYSWHESMLSHGIVGGRLFSPGIVAERTANLAVRLLRGESVDAIPVSDIDPYVTRFDWRQLERWGISGAQLPPDSIVLFRPVGFWEQYHRGVAISLLATLIFAALGSALWFEHGRRGRAEVESRQYLTTMADLDRRAAMGQLTAALAHELRQPLGAILRNSEAAKIILDAGSPDLRELHAIVEDIRKDDKRAAEVVRRIKTIMQEHTRHEELVDMNELARDTAALIAEDAGRRGVGVELALEASSAWVIGDRVHLQQMLLNLVLNGLEAMTETSTDGRRIVLSTASKQGQVDVAVRDQGSGIPAGVSDRMFEPFFSTKTEGMGMGLAIAQNIARAHDGRIVATNNIDRGATVRVSIPLQPDDRRMAV